MLNTFKIGHKVVRMTPERLHHIFRLFQLLTLKRQMFAKMMVSSLREKCPYSELFSPNAGKYRREYLRIRALFTHLLLSTLLTLDMFLLIRYFLCYFILQSIIEIVVRRLGANIALTSKYYGLKLENTETKNYHWLNPTLTMIEVKTKYRSEFKGDEVWKYVSPPLHSVYILTHIISMFHLSYPC